MVAKLLKQFFDLSGDCASMEEIRNRIEADASIKGTNLAILIMAILIASVGLNMNSTAVIIGAMLISPLMGGIVATGYGMASYDMRFIRRSLIKLFFQVLFSLAASALYFTLSPISTASPELLSRTAPTIWDVIIALCGGLAGAIGNTRVEKSNVVPGVAIATALMPPLCTAGYGIAVHSFTYFMGALYLFFINSFFIALAGFVIFKILCVPVSPQVSALHFQRLRRALIGVGIIVTVPSIYFAYQSVNANIEESQIQKFLQQEARFDRSNVISHELSGKTLRLDLVGMPLTEEQIAGLQQALQQYSRLRDIQLKVVQDRSDSTLSKEDIQQIINNKLDGNEGNKGQSYKEQAHRYYPDYQQAERDKQLIRTVREQAPILFPVVRDVQGGSIVAADADGKGDVSYQKFAVQVYVSQPMARQEAVKLQQWIEKQVHMPVMASIRLVQDRQEAVYGDGME